MYKLLYYLSYLFTFYLISFWWHHSFHTVRGKFAHHIFLFFYLHNGYFISTSVCVSVNCTVFNLRTNITYIMHMEYWVVSFAVSNFAEECTVYVRIQCHLLFWI